MLSNPAHQERANRIAGEERVEQSRYPERIPDAVTPDEREVPRVIAWVQPLPHERSDRHCGNPGLPGGGLHLGHTAVGRHHQDAWSISQTRTRTMNCHLSDVLRLPTEWIRATTTERTSVVEPLWRPMMLRRRIWSWTSDFVMKFSLRVIRHASENNGHDLDLPLHDVRNCDGVSQSQGQFLASKRVGQALVEFQPLQCSVVHRSL